MSLDLNSIQHHHALEEIVDILCSRTQEQDRSFFRAEVAYFFAKVAASMRASILTKDRGELPVNMYAIDLAESGFGKGYSMAIMETEILSGFRRRFMEDTFPIVGEQNLWTIANSNAGRSGKDPQEEYDKLAKEFDRLGPLAFTFDSGSTPAIKQFRQKLLLANAGAVNLQIDEIGSNLQGQVEALTTFLELYDLGMIKQKLKMNTKDQQRGEEIDGRTPTNALLFGTPAALFDGGATEAAFYALLETGYARRCFFGYGIKNMAVTTQTAKEIYTTLTSPTVSSGLEKWTRHFFKLADAALFNWKMDVDEDVGIALIEYKMHCEATANQMADHDFVRKAEMAHRYSKALKLAGAYAFIDGSTNVELDHLYAAIKLTEESGQCFHAILNRDKAYMRLAKYIAQIGTPVTHSDLHEALPFYKSSQAARNEMMTMAISYGYKKHISIKKSFIDGVEIFTGETLKETDLSQIVVSYSDNWAYNYSSEIAPFEKLHLMTQADGIHWANHHFKDGHRSKETTLAGFNMIVIDVDGGCSLELCHELMKDYIFMTYTTKRHSDEENRFRLMLPSNYHLKLDDEEYAEFMNGIMGWLPFPTDESANQRSKKWESFAGGTYHYNMNGKILDVLDFIPKTTRNEQYQRQSKDLGSLDNLERWFASRIASGNRNNQMIKYALCLVDAGWDLPTVRSQVHAFNKKLSNAMSEQEVDSTILVTVAKRYQEAA